MKKLLFILLVFCLILPASGWATTFYMNANGTAEDEIAAVGPCTTQANTMSIATHNGNWADLTDDTIILCDDGGGYSGSLAIASSGATYIAESGTTPTIDGSGNNYTIFVNAGTDNLTIDGLILTSADDTNIYLNDSEAVTIQNCSITLADNKGISIGTIATSFLIQNNTIYDNGDSPDDEYATGIFIFKASGGSGTEGVIKNNSVYSNTNYGIYVQANYWIVENNLVYDNGEVTAMGTGIEIFNGAADGNGENNIVRYNRVYGQLSSGEDGTGILLDNDSVNTEVYGNVCFGNDGPGISVWDATNAEIYNNTTYGNGQDSATSHSLFAEIFIGSDADNLSGIVIKNNVSVATDAGVYAIYCDSNCEGSAGLDISSNMWSATAANWYYWNAGAGDTLATWNALTGVGTDYNDDPLFTNAAADDYTLTHDSPAIDAGVDLGDTYTYALNPNSSWPNAVNTINQDYYGTGWEIGAYGFYKKGFFD